MVANSETKILVIGAGGIGSLLTLHVSRAIAFSQWPHGVVEITLMDGDIVEYRNLPHQQFIPEDIGNPKDLMQAHALSLQELIASVSSNLTKKNIDD